MKIILSPLKGWHKKRLSQKSPVDEKRSGRPSMLRQVQKVIISKSVHEWGQNTRKLASKLTIQGPQRSKDTVHIYLRCNLGAYSCKRTVLCKISKNQIANDFSFPRRDRSEQWTDLRKIIFTGECSVYLSVPETCKNDHVRAQNGSKVEPTQMYKFSPKIMVWGIRRASGVSKLHVLPPKQAVRAKYNQESILSFFLPDDMNQASDTGIVSERRFHENMLDLTLLQDGARAHKATESQDRL